MWSHSTAVVRRRAICTLLCPLFLAPLIDREAAAQVFVESVFPPAVQRGEVNRVTLHGTNLAGATGLWTSLPENILQAQVVDGDLTPAFSGMQSVVVELQVSPDAPLGLYGLRLATQEGLSNVHLFAIDEVAPTAENEVHNSDQRNDRPFRAQEVSLPAAVLGVCRDTDLDHYLIEVSAGERVAFELIGNRLGKAFDPLVTILKADGTYVTERDNDVGLFFDCRFEHQFKEGGRYLVRVNDTRFEGSDHWTYVLRMGRFPVARAAIPSTSKPGESLVVEFPQGDCGPREVRFPVGLTTERFFFDLRGPEHNAPSWVSLAVSEFDNRVEREPNDSIEQATEATIPANLHGVFRRRGDIDQFAFSLQKGQRIQFRSDTRDSGSAADLKLRLLGPDGKEQASTDDDDFDDAAFTFTVPTDGRYALEASEVIDANGPEYVYRIEVREVSAELKLKTAVARLAIPQGTWQPIPLSLTRKECSGPVELSLAGAPDGMRLRNPTFDATANSLTSALDVAKSVPPGIYSLQIAAVVTPEGETSDQQTGKAPVRCFAETQPLIDRVPDGRGPHGEPFELRMDQRRLPPTLTNRIAVLVLPASPFDFDITTNKVVLPRYSTASFQIATRRTEGFTNPIQFSVRGGQLDMDRLRKPRVNVEVPDATVDTPKISPTLHSVVNSELLTHAVAVTGTSRQGDRVIHLTRTFELQVKVAFAPSPMPAKLNLHPGESATVRLSANRLSPFDGRLDFELTKVDGLTLPASLAIAPGQEFVEFEVEVTDNAKPGKHRIKFPATTRVNRYFESGEGEALEIEIVEQDPN